MQPHSQPAYKERPFLPGMNAWGSLARLLWGPLRFTLTDYREGAERGYEAGQIAYRDACSNIEEAMRYYLAIPRYRPRACTPQIVEEWRAMFVLGWTSQYLEDLKRTRITD